MGSGVSCMSDETQDFADVHAKIQKQIGGRTEAAQRDPDEVLPEEERQRRVSEQERAYNAAVERAARNNHFVRKENDLVECRSARDWVHGQPLKVFVGTWNMEGKGVPGDVREMVGGADRDRFHIYAIGAQECLRTIAKSFVNSDKTSWEDLIGRTLGNGYTLLSSSTLVAIHLAVFVRNDVRRCIAANAVESSRVTTGALGGNLGNKGCVGVAFTVGPVDSSHSVSFLFLNAHFAAHQDNTSERNADYEVIARDLQLGSKGKAVRKVLPDALPEERSSIGLRAATPPGYAPSSSPAAAPVSGGRPPAGTSVAATAGTVSAVACGGSARDATSEFDCVFWCGDFNYRVNGRRAAVEEMLKGSEDARLALLANDQLTRERRLHNAFRGFHEAEITFIPTYKYDQDSDDFDSKKLRIPAWTDRILFRQHPAMRQKRFCTASGAGDHPPVLRPFEYTSIQHMRFSDHRPVKACFILPTPLPDVTSKPVPIANTKSSSTCSVM